MVKKFVYVLSVIICVLGIPGCSSEPEGLRYFNFYESLKTAQIEEADSSQVRRAEFKINGIPREVIYQHPESKIKFRNISLYTNSRLSFRYGINEKNWGKNTDGVVFKIYIESKDTAKSEIFSDYLKPADNREDRKWLFESISLEEYGGRTVSITFKTECHSNCENDGAGWADMEIISPPPDRVKPNVILISIDTLRADALSCYGNSKNISPGIDSFSGDSILFRNAYSTSTWTLPAHSSMLTGLYPSEHKAIVCSSKGNESAALPLGKEITTITEVMKNEGYYTSAFVSCPWLKRKWGLDQGFLKYDDVWWKTRDRISGRTTGRAREWLKTHDDLPIFMFLHYYDPHAPYYPGNKKFREGLDTKFGNIEPKEFQAWKVMEGKKEKPDKRETKKIKEWYNAEIRYVDYNISRIMETLKNLGLYEESLIIITSDHGECFGEHNIWGHGRQPYPELTRVPLLIKSPNGGSGKSVISPVSLISLPKTIVSKAGLKYSGFRGNDLLGIKKNRGLKSFIYSEVFHKNGSWRSFVSDGYNLLSFIDLDKKPDDRKNYVYRDFSPVPDKDVLKELKKKYSEFRRREDLKKLIKAPESCKDDLLDEETREQLKSLGYLN